MSNLETRLRKLEDKTSVGQFMPKVVHLDGTREEVEAQLAALDDEDGTTVAVIIRPYIGETVNEVRINDGLAPADIPEWTVPR